MTVSPAWLTELATRFRLPVLADFPPAPGQKLLGEGDGAGLQIAAERVVVYEMPGTDNKIVVPSVILKTTNIVRAIVQINENRVEILPAPDQDTKSKGASLTDEEFFERLDKLHRGISIKLIEFLNSCDDLQVQWEIKKTLIVKLVIGGLKTIAFVIFDDGRVDFGYAWNSKIFFRPFVERIIAAVPGSALKESPKSWYAKKQKTGEMLTVWELLDHAEGVRAALEVLNESMRIEESKKEG